MKLLCLFSLLWSLALSQDMANVNYLRNTSRLNDSSLLDYYFSCNIVGPNLRWQVNGNILNFDGNQSIGDVAERRTTDLRSFSIILSVDRVDNRTVRYSSVLIVTSLIRGADVSLAIRCITGNVVASITNDESIASANDNKFVMRSTGDFYFGYLFSAEIVNQETTTHVFSCGANATRIALQATGTIPLIFRNNLDVGVSDQIASADGAVLTLKSILTSSEPLPLTSVTFATRIDSLNVSCSSPQTAETISFAEVLAAQMIKPTSSGNGGFTNTTIPPPPPTSPSTPPPPPPCDGPCIGRIAGLIIVGILGISVCIGVTLFILRRLLVRNRKRNPTVHGQSDFEPEDSKPE